MDEIKLFEVIEVKEVIGVIDDTTKMSNSKTFTEVKAWQKAHEFVLTFYQSKKAFPEDEKFALESQFQRAAISIAANTFTAPAGKMFVGWNTAANGSGTSYAVGAAVSSNLTLFAQWQTIYGELIKATLTSGSAATVTGVIGGTADVSLSSSKKMDKGKYFGVSLASDSFQEGDTVIITMTTVGSNYPCLFEDKDRTNCLFLATATSSDLVYKIVLPAAANGLTTLYLSRDANDSIYKWNPVLSSFAVVRPMPIVSEAWESLTIDNGPTSYNRTGTVVNVVDAYLDPTVVVTKHVVYADATEANVDVEVTDLEVVGNQYVGHVTIGGDVYTINIAKLASVLLGSYTRLPCSE